MDFEFLYWYTSPFVADDQYKNIQGYPKAQMMDLVLDNYFWYIGVFNATSMVGFSALSEPSWASFVLKFYQSNIYENHYRALSSPFLTESISSTQKRYPVWIPIHNAKMENDHGTPTLPNLEISTTKTVVRPWNIMGSFNYIAQLVRTMAIV